MLDYEGHESVRIKLQLQEKFADVLGELKPVSPDAVGMSDTKIILLRQALVHNLPLGLFLVSYPEDSSPVSRTQVKVTRSILDTERMVQTLSSISIQAAHNGKTMGEKFTLARENDDEWRYQVKRSSKDGGSSDLRVDREATPADMSFFSEVLDVAMNANIRRIAIRDTMADPKDSGKLVSPQSIGCNASCYVSNN